MASSRRSSRPDADGVAQAVAAALAGAHAKARSTAAPLAVALSGGRDSVALLDATVAWAAAHARRVVALHVHHGLSANADAWADACQALAASLGADCDVRRVTVPRSPRRSVEAAARAARYAALASAARERGADTILLAHHRDDQAETVLLQLLRGAGPHGLAAMPAERVDADGLVWLRPLLGVARFAIDAYVEARGLRFVDDESNADPRYARNALRRDVAPALAKAAPAYGATLARAAALQADAARLADDLARHDVGAAYDGATLDRRLLATLPDHRARNALRWFLRERGLSAPSHARLAAMLSQLATARAGARVRIAHAGVEIGVHRERVVVHAPPPAAFERTWNGEPALALAHGRLAFISALQGGGLDPERLRGAPVVVRSRRGGERLALGADRPRRALTRMLQESGTPLWERSGIPLVWCGDRLAAVPGIGVDVAFQAPPDRPSIALEWSPTPVSSATGEAPRRR